MRKKLFMWMAALAFGFAIVSCSSDDAGSTDLVTPVTPDTETADYTVIFWGMSGKCDTEDCVDLARLAYNYQQGLVGKKVNIAGLMKTSVSLMFNDQPETVDKTWYFDSEKIDKTKTIPESERTTMQTTGAGTRKTYEDAFAVMNGREYADTQYPLNNVDSLAAFIKRTAEKFPARHYVLLTFGHGGGFSPVNDTPRTTKVSVPDYFRQGMALAADDVVSAVEKSGVKIQTYFTHSCLMASLENMAAFSQVFDYAILAAEITYGHYLPEYVEKLSQAGSDEAKMLEKSRELIDYYANLYDSYADKEIYTSHGFYDLKQTESLLSIVKEAADWYTENYTGADEAPIEKAMMDAVCCVNLEDLDYAEKTPYLRKARTALRAMINGESDADINEKELTTALGVIHHLLTKTPDLSFGFVMADVLRNTLNAKISQDKIARLKDIYDRYMTTLKGMAYIGATLKPANADADYAYIYASPTVNIFSLNPDYFIPIPEKDEAQELIQKIMTAIKNGDEETYNSAGHTLMDGTPFANRATLKEVKYNYTSSVFDQKVKWSRFLEKAKFNLSVVTNIDRWFVNEKWK